MCIVRVCTCNINTTILAHFVQYYNIDQIKLLIATFVLDLVIGNK